MSWTEKKQTPASVPIPDTNHLAIFVDPADSKWKSKDNAAALSIFATEAYANALVAGLLDDRGDFDASVNAYPSSGGSGTAGAIMKGDIWRISVAGTLPTGQTVVAGDWVRALIDTPGNTQGNWAIAENNIGYVPTNAAIVPSTVPSAGQILVGNAGGTAYAPVSMGTDATLASTGALTIAAASVTLAKMADLAQDQFIGRVSASTGVPETATITAAARTVLDDTTVAAMVDTLGGAAAVGTGGLLRASGPAGTATALATPRAINGVNFDGSAAITIKDGYGLLASQQFVSAARMFCIAYYNSMISSTVPSTVNDSYGTAGTVTMANETQGQFANLASAATTNSEAGLQAFGTKPWRLGYLPVREFVIKTGSVGADITVCRIRAGLYSGGPLAADALGVNGVGFRYCPATDGTAFWRTESFGGAETVTATSVAIVADTYYHLAIDATDPTSVKFYINGTLVATHTTNLPATTTDMGWLCRMITLEDVAKNLKISSTFGTRQ